MTGFHSRKNNNQGIRLFLAGMVFLLPLLFFFGSSPLWAQQGISAVPSPKDSSISSFEFNRPKAGEITTTARQLVCNNSVEEWRTAMDHYRMTYQAEQGRIRNCQSVNSQRRQNGGELVGQVRSLINGEPRFNSDMRDLCNDFFSDVLEHVPDPITIWDLNNTLRNWNWFSLAFWESGRIANQQVCAASIQGYLERISAEQAREAQNQEVFELSCRESLSRLDASRQEVHAAEMTVCDCFPNVANRPAGIQCTLD